MKLNEDRIILYVTAGSRAYGTNTSKSDYDYRGIFIAEHEYYHGFAKHVEQVERKNDDEDVVIYELRKFMKLASRGNPNVLEILGTRSTDIIKCTKAGEKLREHRNLFLSKACKFRYSGYAYSQLKRIKTHRFWLLNPPKKKPERRDFNLPEHKKLVPKDWIDALSQSDYTDIGNVIGFVHVELIEAAKKEKQYKDAITHWKQYINWKETRNPKRAELEAKYLFDCKHGSHLIRLMRQCIEILEGKGLIVYRPDAEELLAIRNGAWSYERLIEEAKILETQADSLYKTSMIPNGVDMNKIDNLCIELVKENLYE